MPFRSTGVTYKPISVFGLVFAEVLGDAMDVVIESSGDFVEVPSHLLDYGINVHAHILLRTIRLFNAKLKADRRWLIASSIFTTAPPTPSAPP